MYSREWDDFIQRVHRAKHRLGCSKTPGSAFYRGHMVADWYLLPSLFRYKQGLDYEKDIYADFLTRSGYLLDRSKSSWEILAEMRHHGVPTRLLDWTTSFSVALYFSLAYGIQTPCVWILNPFRLTRRATGKPVIYHLGLHGEYDYVNHFVKESSWPYDLPLAMACPWRNSRLEAQQGYFTIHGNEPKPIEELTKRYVKKIELPEVAIGSALQFLELSGINEHRLFPDLDGLARWLNKKFDFTNK